MAQGGAVGVKRYGSLFHTGIWIPAWNSFVIGMLNPPTPGFGSRTRAWKNSRGTRLPLAHATDFVFFVFNARHPVLCNRPQSLQHISLPLFLYPSNVPAHHHHP